MPRYDKTGPRGQGPMTGRGMGPCGQGMAWGGRGRGWGRPAGGGGGWGQGAGFPWWIQQSDDKEAEVSRLEGELEEIKAAIKALKDSSESK